MKVTAIWFGATIGDTNDISTQRGGSLAMLLAPNRLLQHLQNEFAGKATFDPIISGASTITIDCTPVPGSDSEPDLDLSALVASVRAFLSKRQALLDEGDHKSIDLNTVRFAVAAVPKDIQGLFVGDGFQQSGEVNALALLDAQIAMDQYRQASFHTFTPLAEGKKPTKSIVCQLDGKSPAVETDRTTPVGSAVLARRTFGRERKSDFFKHILDDATDPRRVAVLKRLETLPFSQSLQDLSVLPPDPEQEFQGDSAALQNLPGAISNKIAVLYLDGNSFGKNLARNSIDERRAFSQQVRTHQANMLVHLLNWAAPADALDAASNDLIAPKTPDVTSKDAARWPERLRLEILLWGGDEVAIAMPAWRAFETVAVIEQALCKFRIDWPDGKSETLTHSVGLAFANVKTPIRSLKAMAENLADDAKSLSKTENVFSIGIAEAVDVPGDDITGLRARGFKAGDGQSLAFDPSSLGQEGTFADVWNGLRALDTDLPASQGNTLLRGLRKQAATAEPDASSNAGKLSERDYIANELRRLAGATDEQVEETLALLSQPFFATDRLDIGLSWRSYLNGFVCPFKPRFVEDASDGGSDSFKQATAA
ncbi:MAG: hypothetical protein AAGM04_13420 [Pseudomonadota bacterium]